ncbi:class I SAM-dependent methyltransferase [Propionibacterium freudenreichii]|uniref:class I SAM-dependent methyltransferase n=1 Tax=Propionibacterium freudenreichii TaxID=1744 RepID=UPI000543B3C7|nr:methyltransferase [Propionibacterium freudenreichii]MCT2975152.1 methyltransferase domain-containing protein [Propionibacterium freudenreichii]MCT2994650.1 methyltransferase domain-containing protein [Propionibacterium freudenreichii]MCT2997124.1 methyltransferase domain-containing protein [Propionibacterium freudenreichii]MCT3002194.1 methyltransferase domain-containing protein [Propionibacterium freudenreichii]MDK9302246.1 methyltransferase [Propionibacterium freudenreichii]
MDIRHDEEPQMTQYFVNPEGPAKYHQLHATIWGHDYEFRSSNGVFSQYRLDLGTSVLLRTLDPPADRPARFLDLGCGFGPIAVALATECPRARVDAIDVNERAVELTAMNAKALGVASRVSASAPDQVPADVRYDEIWSNPPIRIGKAALHELLDTWLNRLTEDGVAHLVVAHNLGSDSLAKWLTGQGWQVDRLGSAKGYRVFDVTRRH